MSHYSKIFVGNRALGYVSNEVPCVVRYIRRRKENLVLTCVGRSFHTYACARLTLLSVSDLHSDDISYMAADSLYVYTACGNVVYAWRLCTTLTHTYAAHTSPVHLLQPFGHFLISVDEESNFKVWNVKTEEVYSELQFDNSSFQITTIVHPSTYLNKVLLGSSQGSLELWNVHTMKRVYTFSGWGSGVTALEQAPAVDVVAVGLENGRIIIHNLKFDETLMEFVQDWGCVTSLSFRTDGPPILASGSLLGNIVFWDLETRKVSSQLLQAHTGSVAAVKFLPNEPLMITNSPDNSLRMWIFDMMDGGARLHNFREGHSGPPTFVRFYGSDGHNVLSVGGDPTLRIFSTKTETFNKSLGRASYNRKSTKKKKNTEEDHKIMPPIVKIAFKTTREKEWDNIAALHKGLSAVSTWSYDRLKMGETILKPELFKTHKYRLMTIVANCTCITHCGNFVIVGYSTGHAYKFNIQSGLERGSYGEPTAHAKGVTGIATDNMNHFTISGASDGLIKFWHFQAEGNILKPSITINVKEPVSFFSTHEDSAMLGVAIEDYSMIIVDMDTQRITRKFIGHSSFLLDATFSPDARWLVTTAMDATICTWDIPTSQLIDCFQVDSICNSVSFSPTGDLLATTHVNNVGVFLWSNVTLFSHVSLRPIYNLQDAPLITLPTTLGLQEKDSEADNSSLQENDASEFESPEQISDELITLSLLSNSRWQNLLNIDIIKKRNKPRAPPKKPEDAPFFLPTVKSLEPQFDFSKVKSGEDKNAVGGSSMFSLTVFGKLLNDSVHTNDFEPVVNKLKSLGPSAIDMEIHSLAPDGGGSIVLMLQFMKLVDVMLSSNKDFELAQAYLGLFLKTHGETIASQPQLSEYIPVLQKAQLNGWQRLQDKLMYNSCVVQSVKMM